MSQPLLRIDQALAADALSLVVFLPDAVGSRLIGPVELWLRERTACAPIARSWLTHTDEELRRFYPDVPQRFWPLVSRAFCWGPSLVTLWLGERAAQLIPASKGVTEPGRCSAASVHLRHLNPLPPDLGQILRQYGRVLVPEINSGQLVRVLRSEYLVDAVGFNRVRGVPLASSEILEAIVQVAEGRR